MKKKTETTNKVEKNQRADKVEKIITPRITEKATIQSELRNIYTFNVPVSLNKKGIRVLVKKEYKVNPIKITTVTTPSQGRLVRGVKSKTSAFKKAYVYLKKGDKIEFA